MDTNISQQKNFVLLYPASPELLARALREIKKKYSLSQLQMLVIAHRGQFINTEELQSVLNLEFPQGDNLITLVSVKGMMQKSWHTIKTSFSLPPAPAANTPGRREQLKLIAAHNKRLLDNLATNIELLLLESFCLHHNLTGIMVSPQKIDTQPNWLETIEI